MNNDRRISSHSQTVFFLMLSGCFLGAVGIIGSLTIYKFFFVNSADKYVYLLLFLLSMAIYYPVFKCFDKVRYVYLEKNRIWVYKINMLGIGAPTFFPMEQSVYVLSDIRKISSHNLLKNLITLEIFNEKSHRIVKCFVKKGEYKRFRELIDRKNHPQ